MVYYLYLYILVSYTARSAALSCLYWYFVDSTYTIESSAFALIIVAAIDVGFSLIGSWVFDIVPKWISSSMCDIPRGLATISVFFVDIDIGVAYFLFAILIASERWSRLSLAHLVITLEAKHDITTRNNYISMCQDTGWLAGPLIAVIFISSGEIRFLLLLVGIIFIASGIMYATITTKSNNFSSCRKHNGIKNRKINLKTRDIDLFLSIFYYARCNFIVDVVSCILPYLVIVELRGTVSQFGIADALWGVGALICGFAIRNSLWRVLKQDINAIAFFTIFFVNIAVISGNVYILWIMLFLAGALSNIGYLFAETNLQLNTPLENVGFIRTSAILLNALVGLVFFGLIIRIPISVDAFQVSIAAMVLISASCLIGISKR